MLIKSEISYINGQDLSHLTIFKSSDDDFYIKDNFKILYILLTLQFTMFEFWMKTKILEQ